MGAHGHRPVSCYAIIIEWLLPSLSPGCPGPRTSLSTKIWFWNLSDRSGLFPFRHGTFALHVCLDIPYHWVFGVSLETVRLWATCHQRVLYPPGFLDIGST